MIITLLGRIPSKKNSKQVICKGFYPQVLSSQKHKDWHLDASWQLKAIQKDLPKEPLKRGQVKNVVMTIYPPDLKPSDLSNKWESIADLFVDCRIFEDDNWFVLGDTRQIFGGVDRENPRVVIEINLI